MDPPGEGGACVCTVIINKDTKIHTMLHTYTYTSQTASGKKEVKKRSIRLSGHLSRDLERTQNTYDSSLALGPSSFLPPPSPHPLNMHASSRNK